MINCCFACTFGNISATSAHTLTVCWNCLLEMQGNSNVKNRTAGSKTFVPKFQHVQPTNMSANLSQQSGPDLTCNKDTKQNILHYFNIHPKQQSGTGGCLILFSVTKTTKPTEPTATGDNTFPSCAIVHPKQCSGQFCASCDKLYVTNKTIIIFGMQIKASEQQL